APQVRPLAQRFRVVRYDQRGHGQTAVTPGPYTLERLGGDLVALMNALRLERADVVGLSMGGQAGLWLAVHHPQRVRKLVVTNTAAKLLSAEFWNPRIAAARELGMEAVSGRAMAAFHSPGFRDGSPDVVERTRQGYAATPLAGWIAC